MDTLGMARIFTLQSSKIMETGRLESFPPLFDY